jgi:hypothetical protein
MRIQQQAILFTKNNADLIADQLSYTTAQDLLDEYEALLDKFETLVLVRDMLDNGVTPLSHVVTISMFYANATATRLAENYFEYVTQL